MAHSNFNRLGKIYFANPKSQIKCWKNNAKLRFVAFCAKLIELAPLPLAASIKETIHLKGKLDYSGADIYMNTDTFLQVTRLNACKKEPETIKWIEQYIKPGDTFYDIGANVGAYSFVAFAFTKGKGTIYAFEPSFSTFAALNQNILINCCSKNILAFQVALSDQTGLLTFNYSSVTPGASLHNLHTQDAQSNSNEASLISQTIISYRMDDFINRFNLKPPTHIKLDVDGAELSVLRGAETVLNGSTVRSILVEVEEDHPVSNEVINYLQNKRFSIKSRHPHGPPGKTANYIFVKD